jgi:outer membrane protein
MNLFSIVTMQLFVAIAAAIARNDPPPSSDRPWTPPDLPKYERELAGKSRTEPEENSKISINPRKVYGLAELIDIAQRNNPETRVAWERARLAAAAVGLSQSAYYPYLAASAAAGYDRSCPRPETSLSSNSKTKHIP